MTRFIKPLVLTALALFSSRAVAGVVIVDDFITINSISAGATNAGEKWYDVKNDTGVINPNFQGANLGTFNILSTPVSVGGVNYAGSSVLQITGGQIKTTIPSGGDYQTSSNFGRLFYAVTAAGVNPSSFTQLNLDTFSGSWPNYQFDKSGQSINLINGLSVGSYQLSIYFETNGSWWNGSSQQFYSIPADNNGGNNYKANFNLVPEPSSGLLIAIGLASLVAMRCLRKKS